MRRVTPFRAAARTAERDGLDGVLLRLPTAPRALRAIGKVDGLRVDPLPLLGGATERIGLGVYWPGDVAGACDGCDVMPAYFRDEFELSSTRLSRFSSGAASTTGTTRA